MSRKNKALRGFLHKYPNATLQEVWDAAWEKQQGRAMTLAHKEKDKRISELERLREIDDRIISEHKQRISELQKVARDTLNAWNSGAMDMEGVYNGLDALEELLK